MMIGWSAPLSLKARIFKILYRLTLPGGLLMVLPSVFMRFGILTDSDSPTLRFFPLAVFLAGLALSAVFRRSRLFFAMLALALAQTALAWIVPYLSADAGHVLTNAIALLLPLNLLTLAFLRERGIISPAGRRRLAIVGAQILAVGILCLPQLKNAAAFLERPFVSENFSRWSHLSQPALLAFVLAVAIMMGLLIQRYRSVESSLLWALLAAFVALRLDGSSNRAGVFFATGGMALIVALLETSYRMAYHDELTQLPSRRALNEALMKLPEAYTIAMLDVDHFKKFNDTYGHEAGDQALRLVASRLARFAGGGRAYRYGGEEFAVLFPGKLAQEVFAYVDGMRRIIEQSTFVVRGKERRKGKTGKTRTRAVKKETNVTVSIGVAESNNGTRLAPAEVLRMADQALYRAKAKGRNCTVTARRGKNPTSVEPGMRIVSVS
jgi:diguanylate cyclase (GGDEF)-like protein